MKILYLITKSEIGGAQIHLAHLLKYFSKENELALVSAPFGFLENEAQKFNAKFYPNPYFSNSLNPFNLYRSAKLIRKAIKDFQPDIIHCHSSMAGILGRLIVRNKIPTIYTAHGFAFNPDASLWRRIIGVMGEKAVSRYTSKIICVSDFDKGLALKYKIAKASKLAVVHNGVEIGPFELKKESGDLVEILSIGRLAYPKRPDLIIKAFAKLPIELRQKSYLKIVGSGPYFSELQKLIDNLDIKESISLVGEVDHSRIGNFLSKADIFILITKHEGLPLTILEAMSKGLPIIASKVGGVPEEVNNECGILIDKNEVKEIKNALALLISDEAKRREMGLLSRKRAEQFFSLEKFFIETAKIYKEILNQV